MLKLSILMLYADVTLKFVVTKRLCSLTVQMKRWEGGFVVNTVRSQTGGTCACMAVCREFDVT